jgi:hypothetical protein
LKKRGGILLLKKKSTTVEKAVLTGSGQRLAAKAKVQSFIMSFNTRE